MTRAVIIWLCARLGVIPIVLIAHAGSPVLISTPAMVVLTGGATAAAWVEVLRREDQLFLGNVGVGRITLLALCLIPIALAEVTVNGVLRVLV